MPGKRPTLSERVVTLLCVLVVLWWIAYGTPSLGQEGNHLSTSGGLIIHSNDLAGTLSECLSSECGPLLVALTEQSEADSLRIKELEISLFYANLRTEAAENEKPNWVERFFARYGFALGAAAGVYVGAAAAR